MGSAGAGLTYLLLKEHYDEFVALNPIRLLLHGKFKKRSGKIFGAFHFFVFLLYFRTIFAKT